MFHALIQPKTKKKKLPRQPSKTAGWDGDPHPATGAKVLHSFINFIARKIYFPLLAAEQNLYGGNCAHAYARRRTARYACTITRWEYGIAKLGDVSLLFLVLLGFTPPDRNRQLGCESLTTFKTSRASSSWRKRQYCQWHRNFPSRVESFRRKSEVSVYGSALSKSLPSWLPQ